MFNKLKYVLLLLFIIGCSISADKTTLDFGSTETSKTLTITVQGAMEWNISCNENWVTVNPDHGQTTGAMTTQSINVIVDRTVLDPGDYEASLMMSTNWNLPCSDVLIKMKVEDKEPPLPPAVEGYIYDKDTNETLAEVFVSVESSSDTSDDSGYYHVEVTTTGLKTIIASKEGYEDYSTEINIIKEMVQHDIYLIAIEGTTTTIVSTSTTTATFIPTTIPTTIPATTSTTTLVTSTIPPDVNIIWLQQEISDEVFPGSVSINHATFTSDTDLENVEFLIAQELQQFVIVEPESIEVITAGEENQVNIVMAAPLDVSFGSWNGPVNAKIGNKTYNQPLKVNVKVVQPSVEDVPEGISIPLADRITMDQVLEKEYVKDEIIIIFNLDANIESIKKIISDIGGVIIGCDLRMNVFQVQIQEDNPEALDQILDILEANTNVESASRHWLIPGEMAIPNDPLFDSWGQETPEGNNWGQELIKLVSAWNIETGKSSVKIGIVDTGFDIYHEDLIGNIDYQHYGYFHDISGRSHGTHVAGTAGAVGNNGKGISGVSWNCSLFVYNSEFPIYKYNILGLPVLETTEATYYTVANMIMNAIDDGANVINLSMGHTFKTLNDLEVLERCNKILGTPIRYAQMKGKEVLFVFSAGNEHRDTCLATPASLSNVFPNNVITVAAVDKNEDLAGFSNYGSCVNVAAPGVDIYSTIPNNDYGNKSGTSMAAPFVTGLAALLWSHDDTLTATQVKNLIVQGAKVGGKQLWGPEGYIFYIINAYQSLKLLEEPAETGIEGTVYYSTTPLSNVKVSLWTDTNEIPGTEVYTDENGEYKILYDIPGEYHILAFLPNSVYWSSCYQIVINEGEIILLDFYLIKPLKLLSPPNGAIISDTTPTFVWEANPEVVNYLLSIFDGIPPAGNLVVNQAGITNTSYTLPDPLSPGFYIWSIIGFDLGGNSVTGFYYFEFNIE